MSLSISAFVPSPRAACAAFFFVSGAVYATWGVHIPHIRERFGLDPARLSIALLALALRSIAAMPAIGRAVGRVGSRGATRAGAAAMVAGLALVMAMPSYPVLLAWLLLFGAANGLLDVAMNAQAAQVEERAGRPLMSAMHGMFSLGGLVGAAAAIPLVAAGVSPLVHCAGAAAVAAAVALAAGPGLLHCSTADARAGSAATVAGVATQPAELAPQPAATRRTLWLLGGLAFTGLVAEGAMYDWTTVYLRDVGHAGAALAASGYALFSLGMVAGRFTGDTLRARWGGARLLAGGAVLAAAGASLAIAWPAPLAAAAGFGCVGLGVANMMPVLITAASRQPGAPAVNIAFVSRLAYSGMLLGPVLIGGVAQWAGLRVALGVVALAALLIAAAARRMRMA